MKDRKELKNIRFALAENLMRKAKIVAEQKGISKGLVILSTYSSVDSPIEFDVKRVEGNPIDVIKDFAKEEGITQEKINEAFAEKMTIESREKAKP